MGRHFWNHLLLVCALSFSFLQQASAQAAYTVTDLGTLGGSSSYAYGINSLGQVVGYSVRADGYPCAFIYSNGTMLNLGAPAGSAYCSAGYAINNAGQATGQFSKPWVIPQYPVSEAFLYSGGMTDIGTLSTVLPCCGTSMSSGNAINNLGQVAGNSYLNDQSTMGFLWSKGSMTPIGSLYTGPSPAPYSAFYWSGAVGINDSGQIVGASSIWSTTTNSVKQHAILWSSGTMKDLGTFGGDYSEAAAINNAGQITGYATYANGTSHAFLYSGGVMQDIGTLGGSSSQGFAINSLGQVIGGASTQGNAAYHVFLYTPGKTPGTGSMVDVQTLLPSGSKWVLNPQGTMGINDAGQIAINAQGAYHALLLTPLSAGITLKATQYGSGGTTIHLQWNYGDISTSTFYLHRQPPSGGVYVIPVDADPTHCSGSLHDSVCTYDDSAITAYGTYSYTVQASGYDPPSNTSTAYQLNTFIDAKDPSAIFSRFTPDPSLSVSAVAQAMGYDHFNWIQVITNEPACDPLHVYDPAFAVPTKGAAVMAPHLDPPLGGYTEFQFYETQCDGEPCAGPSDNLPYYFDENPNTGDPLYWFMYPTATPRHQINPGGTLDSSMANGPQTAHIMARFYDQPQEACITGSDYMGFVNTLVGVKTGVGQLPSTSDALTSYVWSSNYNGKIGGVKRESLPSWETPYDPNATGGIFNVAPVDVNSLPLNLRQILVDNGVQGVTILPGGAPIAPMTAAFLSGTQGMNNWYTSPVQVTLIPTDVSGPSSIASTSYNLDAVGAEPYTASFTVSTNGVHTVVYGSTDTSSNAENPQPSTTINIDQVPPTSHVTVLPANENSANFTVQWSGNDATSGIQDYTIYVSDNGGAFTPWQTNISATSATFNGTGSHTYGFYSLARDMAGNVELAKTTAEATTMAGAGGTTTPTVSVSPSPSPATTTQAVTVTITVSGNPAPTGSVSLTSGSYAPTAVTLNSGNATIVIPAGTLPIGSNNFSVAYTPDTASSSTYNSATGSASVIIQGYPVVTWPTPAAITYGTVLSGTQLNASATGVTGASLPGVFTYSPLSGTVLTAGSQTLSVSFAPTDTTDYTSPVLATVQLQVIKANPTLTWTTPAAITYGTALNGTQLNAVATGVTGASLSGVFTYSPLSGAVLMAGSQTLSVSFAPTDTTDYTTPATTTVQLQVSKAASTVTLVSSLNPILLQNPVTYTATVSSTAGKPTGTVTFDDGGVAISTCTGVAVTTATGLANCAVTYTTTGSHSITVLYNGDTNFLSAGPSNTVSEAAIDINLGTLGTASSETILPGGTAAYSFPIAPSSGTTFPSPVTFTVTGLPTGATATLAPSAWALTSSNPWTWTLPANTALTGNTLLSIQVPQTIAALQPVGGAGGNLATRLAPFSLALILLPFAGRLRRTGKRLGRLLMVLLLLGGGMAAMTGLSGCGSNTGFFAQAQRSYPMTVTVSSGSLSHTSTITLTVE